MKLSLLRYLFLIDAAVLSLLGALLIFAPKQLETAFGFRDLPPAVSYLIGLWGCVLGTLAIGYIVAAAMMKGSGGLGGRRYQIAAVALTYMAVSLSFIPIAINQARQSALPKIEVSEPAKPTMSPGRAIGALVLVGLAAPFLELADPVHGIIGMIILFVGMRIAWRKAEGVPMTIDGPFSASPPAAAAT